LPQQGNCTAAAAEVLILPWSQQTVTAAGTLLLKIIQNM
jgi:hypothetical protein